MKPVSRLAFVILICLGSWYSSFKPGLRGLNEATYFLFIHK